MADANQALLIANLCRMLQQGHGISQVQVLETHISYVLLTGQYAYKIKKAVKLPFLDFSTLAQRHFFCLEELRLNQRCAPQLYIEVVAIGGTLQTPILDGEGPAIEYAVKMREFDQSNMLGPMLDRGEFSAAQIDTLADRLAAFQQSCPQAGADSEHGTGQHILKWALDNFSEMLPQLSLPRDVNDLAQLRRWTQQEFDLRDAVFMQRKVAGRVREGHGDLHLGNIAQMGDKPVFFDCIEFSADLRWIDVVNEAAFLVVDLQAHNRPDFAYRFLNAYLEATGDYGGLAVLRFYCVYRLVVRAKVALLRNATSQQGMPDECRRYVDLALHWTRPSRANLVLMHGYSGSGKTVWSQMLLQEMEAVRVRSDVERKRMAGLPAHENSQSEVGGGLYADGLTAATYQRLLVLAQTILGAGYSVIVDAAFLHVAQRKMFCAWATAQNVPFAIVSMTAPEAVLRERVTRRIQSGLDASEASFAVLSHQLHESEPFHADEWPSVVTCDATLPMDTKQAATLWQTLRQRLA